MDDTPASRDRAVALAYHPEDQAEDQAAQVIAGGYGSIAEHIISQAGRLGIHVHQEPALISLLMQLELDQQIPPRLYPIIAELLVWIDELRD